MRKAIRKTVEQEIAVCDVCGKEILSHGNIIFTMRDRYGNIFYEGSPIIDLCGDCYDVFMDKLIETVKPYLQNRREKVSKERKENLIKLLKRII